ncbi:hypothetical protein ETF27_07770 [Prevotella brunnea]|uniref:Uncharacterized protein n=1 Tax=Prevotella brunnea TaxID=2508867 RepID=A0A5C8GGA4_9BACT|nr:hypothetical protein [Prevotella brunnea]TXJ60864.1 hypothetical protein ETF27_07770 [Prevotella brunnea]
MLRTIEPHGDRRVSEHFWIGLNHDRECGSDRFFNSSSGNRNMTKKFYILKDCPDTRNTLKDNRLKNSF